MRYRALALVALSIVAETAPVSAQGFVGQIGRFYDDGGWTLYRVGLSRPFVGPLGLTYHGDYFRRVGAGDGTFVGAGLDVTAFRTGAQGPYAVAGIGGGLGSPHSSALSSYWASWSAGAGYDLLPASFLTFGAELRWREISLDHRGGLELAAGLGLHFGGGRNGGAKPATTPAPIRSAEGRAALPNIPVSTPLSAAPISPNSELASAGSYGTAALADSVVETATEMMGRRYEYGGTGEDGDGFDCSGLIQYAYAKHGIELPRRSVDQALRGRGVEKSPAMLRAGDLLTFSSTGGTVTHVALYIGNGQFIHSASGGVQISLLSPDDPYGRWWYQRWVGARRILGG
ncbi:MAG: C40 family peptidase [Gemmatimonadales bacterium]